MTAVDMEPACKEQVRRVYQEEPGAAAEVIRVLGKARIQAIFVRDYGEEDFKDSLQCSYSLSQGMPLERIQ